MPAAAKKYNRAIRQPEATAKAVSDERFQGVLENVFGVTIPTTQPFESDDEQKFAGALENIWGIRLPSEMVTSAYTIFIKEYNQS